MKSGILYTLLVGAAGSLLAAAIQALLREYSLLVGICLIVSLICSLLSLYDLWQRHRERRALGIARWEGSMKVGTTTGKCITSSKKHLAFLGIAASKWLRHEKQLIDMLRRHASNGGEARFLLLDPDSDACKDFMAIKQDGNEGLSSTIKGHVRQLTQLRDKYRLPIEVKVYSRPPVFRITIVDENQIIVGLYSHSSTTGDDTPQLFLRHGTSEYSYYYAFNALFASLWRDAVAVKKNAYAQTHCNAT